MLRMKALKGQRDLGLWGKDRALPLSPSFPLTPFPFNRALGSNSIGTQRRPKPNLGRHRVSFDEGATVFLDPMAVSGPDPDHSLEENRYIHVWLFAPRSVAGRMPYLPARRDPNHQCTSRNSR